MPRFTRKELLDTAIGLICSVGIAPLNRSESGEKQMADSLKWVQDAALRARKRAKDEAKKENDKMDYYVQVQYNKRKAEQIQQLHGGEIISKPPARFSDIPEGKALIVVVDNGPFEAAGFAYNEREFEEFTYPGDVRPKKYVLLDHAKAVELTGFDQKTAPKGGFGR